ncbi:MAG: hypothetical protein NC099_05530, partial [Corallococcus sp.]|nr:hypothetical protein [Corallococcus sp.]
QGLYGFVIAIIGASVQLPTTAKIAGLITNGVTDPVLSAQVMAQGWNIFMACLPMMIGGMVSAILQGKASAATIIAVGKNSEASKAFLFPAMIEFYALLGMVASILLLFNIPVASIPNIPVTPATETAATLISLVVG